MNYLLFEQLFKVLTKSDSERLSILLEGTTVEIQNSSYRLLTIALTMNLPFAASWNEVQICVWDVTIGVEDSTSYFL
jgi:hypothetical protein